MFKIASNCIPTSPVWCATPKIKKLTGIAITAPQNNTLSKVLPTKYIGTKSQKTVSLIDEPYTAGSHLGRKCTLIHTETSYFRPQIFHLQQFRETVLDPDECHDIYNT